MSIFDIEHPDITSAQRTGYATFQGDYEEDTPENRMEFINDHRGALVRWLRDGHLEILDEFIEFSRQACGTSYEDWLRGG